MSNIGATKLNSDLSKASLFDRRKSQRRSAVGKYAGSERRTAQDRRRDNWLNKTNEN